MARLLMQHHHPEEAMALPKGPIIPTNGWRVLHVNKPLDERKGLQINEAAEDILLRRFGKMV